MDTATKRLEMLLELRPKPTKVAVLFDPRDRAAHHEATVVARAAREAKLQVTSHEVRSLADAQVAFRTTSTTRPNATCGKKSWMGSGRSRLAEANGRK